MGRFGLDRCVNEVNSVVRDELFIYFRDVENLVINLWQVTVDKLKGGRFISQKVQSTWSVLELLIELSEMTIKALVAMTLVFNHRQSSAFVTVKPLFADVATCSGSCFLTPVADHWICEPEVVEGCRNLV